LTSCQEAGQNEEKKGGKKPEGRERNEIHRWKGVREKKGGGGGGREGKESENLPVEATGLGRDPNGPDPSRKLLYEGGNSGTERKNGRKQKKKKRWKERYPRWQKKVIIHAPGDPCQRSVIRKKDQWKTGGGPDNRPGRNDKGRPMAFKVGKRGKQNVLFRTRSEKVPKFANQLEG